MKILIATENLNKLAELKEILPHSVNGEEIIYLSLKELSFKLPPETGRTIEENAVIKAKAAAEYSALPALADDTGLEVAYLNGRPGVNSARYAGENKSVKDNNALLLKELSGVPAEKRNAVFKTVAALALPGGAVYTAEGLAEGFIGTEEKGVNGFGYDPLFIVKGKGVTFAEMNAEEKNLLSHRKKAFEKIAVYFNKIPF